MSAMSKHKIIIATASRTLKVSESGALVIADAADLVFTLPKANSPQGRGCRFTIQTKTLSTVTGCQIAPASGDTINGTGITAAASKKIINTAATDAVGDLLEVTCLGDGNWWITDKIGTYAREA